ncbi:hypothetical protein OKW38_006832 [Paraburkholderia sp. MM5496-R1]
MLTGAVHTGAVHTGAVHTGAVHTGAVHTGAVHTGAVHTGAVHTVPSRLRPAAHRAGCSRASGVGQTCVALAALARTQHRADAFERLLLRGVGRGVQHALVARQLVEQL